MDFWCPILVVVYIIRPAILFEGPYFSQGIFHIFDGAATFDGPYFSQGITTNTTTDNQRNSNNNQQYSSSNNNKNNNDNDNDSDNDNDNDKQSITQQQIAIKTATYNQKNSANITPNDPYVSKVPVAIRDRKYGHNYGQVPSMFSSGFCCFGFFWPWAEVRARRSG